MTTPLENVDSDEPTQPTLLEEDSDFAPSPVGESPRRPGPSHTASQSRLTTLDLLLVPKSCISYATWRIRGGRKRLREEGKSKREEKTTGGSLRYLQPCQLVTQMSNHRVMYSLSHRHLPLRQEQIKDTHGISTLRLPHLLLSRQVLYICNFTTGSTKAYCRNSITFSRKTCYSEPTHTSSRRFLSCFSTVASSVARFFDHD
ncbi:hypothetical protein Pcinc_020205 [Petrolisthes cinctipes]|uniref:Uncharacterized protein n=1 Tax=Petrolisthes cinctipes TaxID=88211 RepID=A0AAE1FJS8_PETCI|nr:hypothetical protein Pcinc_020205 [Petrolisthes cinctipes]